MFTKRILCALMCAILLVTAVVPTVALSDSIDYIDYGFGVRVRCTGYLGSTYTKTTIVLSFVSNVNHLPQSDYKCHADAFAMNSSGFVYGYGDGDMSATARAPETGTIAATSSVHICTVNGTQVYYKTLP